MDATTTTRLERKLALARLTANSPTSSDLEIASAEVVIRRLTRKLAA